MSQYPRETDLVLEGLAKLKARLLTGEKWLWHGKDLMGRQIKGSRRAIVSMPRLALEDRLDERRSAWSQAQEMEVA